MGILSDLKKIIFGATAVSKTVTGKAGDFIKEEGGDLLDRTKDMATKSGELIADKTSGLKDSIMENSSELIEKAKDKIETIGDDISSSPIVQKAADISEEVGTKITTVGKDIIDKASDIAENVGEKVIDKGGDLLEKSISLSEDVGEKVLNVKDDLVEKAKEVGDRISQKLDETMDKAEEFEAAEKLQPKRDFAKEDLSAGESLLEGTDDFFSKADKFAEGDYGVFSEGKITIQKPSEIIENTKPIIPASGFVDHDGDGNEIIDDAFLDEEA